MDIEKLKHYYHQAFIKSVESSSNLICSESLLEWATTNRSLWWKNAPMIAIELGCGPYSIFEKLALPEQSLAFGVDFCDAMIEYGCQRNSGKVEYQCLDVFDLETHRHFEKIDFDLIVDGHLFHCLTDQQMREKYLSFVAEKLKGKKGYFILECMVETDDLVFADDFLFLDDTRILLQQIGKEAVPVRYIPKAAQVLEEVERSGLKIAKFLCPSGWKIISDGRRQTAIDGDPGVARLLLSP